jgi:hypothetical protein
LLDCFLMFDCECPVPEEIGHLIILEAQIRYLKRRAILISFRL